MVSRINDKILPEVNEWQNRPLEAVYPVVFFDGIVSHSRKDNKIVTKCVYLYRQFIISVHCNKTVSSRFKNSTFNDITNIYTITNCAIAF